MQKEGGAAEMVRSVFMEGDEAQVIRRFNEGWIEVINRMESGEAPPPLQPPCGGGL